MQKKLLALAIAGAMAAPLAAQAQSGSNVTIYGYLKPSIDYVDNGNNTGTSVRANNSLIGFSGSEDLGNGLKAIFQLESQLDFDERNDNLASDGDGQWVRRDSWLGLSGGFGTAVIGNMFAAYKRSTDFADPFADTIGDYNNIVAAFAEGGDEFNTRFKNAVNYTSPKFGGLQFMATYGLRGDENGNGNESDSGYNADDDSGSVSATYTWGPLTLTAAYEDQSKSGGADVHAWKVGAGYTFGSTTLAALWADENFGRRDTDGDDEPDTDLDRNVLFVSAKHTMGKIDLMASYTMADDFDDVDDSGAKAFALGAAYNFSKRTAITAIYARVDNDDNAGYGFDSGYAPDALGENVSGFSVRLGHRF